MSRPSSPTSAVMLAMISGLSLKNAGATNKNTAWGAHSAQLDRQRSSCCMLVMFWAPTGSRRANDAAIAIDCNRSGAFSAICWATAPPIERPITWARSMPSWSIRPSVASARSAVLTGSPTVELSPEPGLSIAITR